MRVVVVGAGVGGLTAAAVLARSGLDVTVLEANPYPGGCAGTFFHQGYRFDAGATLAAGFYPGGPMDMVARCAGIGGWPARTSSVAMVVHLPDGSSIRRFGDGRRWGERHAAFGHAADSFWRWQERTADALWALAVDLPPWPPQSLREGVGLAAIGLRWLLRDPLRRASPGLVAAAASTVEGRLRGADERLRLFVDAQLLISAQTTSDRANAAFGAAALDLPRRGAAHLEGGMGAIADTLAEAIRHSGGAVLYKETAERVDADRHGWRVRTKRAAFPADVVIANVLPANLARLLGEAAPASLTGAPAYPANGWGAVTAYVGMADSALEPGIPLHHQVVVREPLGEGNSVFVSLSPEWDGGRAPPGKRAVTISTHTDLRPWWELYENDRPAYQERKAAWAERVLAAAEIALPGLRGATQLMMPGTPVTFQRFTGREHGWVGGYPQSSLMRTHAPSVLPRIWMVGDSIFPGQSVTAVALGGLRIARDVQVAAGA